MAVHEGVLTKLVNGVAEYIYPKTTSSMVIYEAGVSEYEKIADLMSDISTNASDIETLQEDLEINTINTNTNAVTLGNLETSVASTNVRITELEDAVTTTNTNVSTLDSDLTTLTARVDSLSTLEEGSTTGDAELIDARTGYDGTTYNSAGEAIRTQIEDIYTSIDDMLSNYGSTYEALSINGEEMSVTVDGEEDSFVLETSFLSSIGLYDTLASFKSEISTLINATVSAAVSSLALQLATVNSKVDTVSDSVDSRFEAVNDAITTIDESALSVQ